MKFQFSLKPGLKAGLKVIGARFYVVGFLFGLMVAGTPGVAGVAGVITGPVFANPVAVNDSKNNLHPNRHPNPFVIQINIERPVLTVLKDGKSYRSYSVALGKPETQTPVGSWRIMTKQKNWGDGFGTRWLGLNVPWGIYGIHGTNRPEYIGTYASNGCIRMRNADVEALYDLIPVGTPVKILGDPFRYLRVLEYGNIGADVRVVQQKLKEAGYFRGACDGIFGPTTQFALIYFELARGIPMDGEVGMDDYTALGLEGIH